MSDAGYDGPIDPDKKGPMKKGPAKKKPQDRTPAEKKADQKAKAEKKQQKKMVERIMFGLGEVMGGAPFNEEFITAALEQGLTPQQVKAIIKSGALGGPTTSADFSSAELLDFFTENPDNIGALFEAVQSTQGLGYDNYAEYLAQGGEPGGYQSPNQLLQAAVFGIEGAKDAYVAGTPFAKYVAEGNDPRRWVLDRWEWGQETGTPQVGPPLPGQGPGGNAPTGPSFLGGFDVDGMNEFGLGDVVSQMMQARAARNNAQAVQGDVFSIDDMVGGEF